MTHEHASGHPPDRHGPGPGTVMDQAFWEELYGSAETVWSGLPNPQLVAEAEGLTPGRALDVGCGEGGDALWLAGRGWQVTAVDISTTALQRGGMHAAAAGADVAGRITWVHADLTAAGADGVRGPADAGAFDLVSAQFMHLPSAARATLHTRLAVAVAPGGTLLVVGHHKSEHELDTARWAVPDLFFTAAQVAATLDPTHWEVTACETRARTVPDPHGGDAEVTVHDAVLAARRRRG